MKCSEIEEIILLYNESSEKQRESVRAHINNCDSCAELFLLHLQTQQLSARVRVNGPSFPDILSRKVMNRIEEYESEKSSTSVQSFLSRFFGAPVYATCMAISIILVISFVIQTNHVEPVKTIGVVEAKNSPAVLNSAAFFQKLKKKKEESSHELLCWKEFNTQNDIDCLKHKIAQLKKDL
jgi:hypothetical protein